MLPISVFTAETPKNWWNGDNETRYKYLYSLEEITELSQKVKTAPGKPGLVFAFFNNHWKAYAPRNSVDMVKNIKLPFEQTPVFGPGSLFEE